MSEQIEFLLNSKKISTNKPSGYLTLDIIRENGLTATKEGCREGECGACTILLGKVEAGELHYLAQPSCMLPVGEVEGKHLVTLEGLTLSINPIQNIFAEKGATQCGFCTPGFIISIYAFLLNSRRLSYKEAIDALDGNICRCTGYKSIERAAKALIALVSEKIDVSKPRIPELVKNGFLPDYFNEIVEKLGLIKKRNISNKSGGVIAGGTDLLIQKSSEIIASSPDFLSRKESLSKITNSKNSIKIGGGVTVESLRLNNDISIVFPTLYEDLLLVSSSIIRNRATVAGNIVNASPIADMAIIFMALNALLHLKKGDEKRIVPLKNFYKGYKVFDLLEREIIENIEISKPSKPCLFSFEKVSRRRTLDIAAVNSAIKIEVSSDYVVEDISISAGGVFAYPLFLEKTSFYLKGRKISKENIDIALQIAEDEIKPISDVRGSAEYKKMLLKNLILAHFLKLFPELEIF